MSTVVAQPYSTAGNGGRKLVRLSNGWLVASVINTTNSMVNFYVSKDNGITWFKFADYGLSGIQDASIVAQGDSLVVIFGSDNAIGIPFLLIPFSIIGGSSSTRLSSSGTIDLNQTAIGNVSLAIDPTNGHLHACWSSKNSSYPNSFNIRYSKSTDGGVTWSSPMMVMTDNQTGVDNKNPSIAIVNNSPVIIHDRVYSTTKYAINCRMYNGTSWTGVTIYNGDTHAQSSPSAVVDKDGVIHVAWHGTDSSSSSSNRIRYSKSIDGGITWSEIRLITTSGSSHFASITIDRGNDLFILFHNASGGLRYVKNNGTEFSTPQPIISGSTDTINANTLYDPYFTGQFGDIVPTIYQTSTSVEYTGAYTTNTEPTFALTMADNQELSEGETLTLSGSAYDVDNGNALLIKYQINEGSIRTAHTGISDGVNPITFSKELTFSDGKLYDGATELTGELTENTNHTLKVWVEDDQGGKSSEETRIFTVILNFKPIVTMINATYPNLIWEVSDPDGTVVRTSLFVNAVELYRIPNPIGQQEYTLTPGKLTLGSNTVVIEAEDNFGAVTKRTFNVNMERVRIPETQMTASMPAETVAEVRLTMNRLDANENVKVTRIIGGIG